MHKQRLSMLFAIFLLGAFADRLIDRHSVAPIFAAESPDRAAIERLHQLDERVTLLYDPKALQAEWTDDAVRLEPNSPVDVGKVAIYASDVRSIAQAPGSAIVRYHANICDVQIVHDWAFEWGLFAADYRPDVGKPVEPMRGKLMRVLRRQNNGEWKFARVMVVFDKR
jgi:ketosteroid isomerase-like protein